MVMLIIRAMMKLMIVMLLIDRPARSDINFSGPYVRRDRIAGIEMDLGLKAEVHLLVVPMDSIV